MGEAESEDCGLIVIDWLCLQIWYEFVGFLRLGMSLSGFSQGMSLSSRVFLGYEFEFEGTKSLARMTRQYDLISQFEGFLNLLNAHLFLLTIGLGHFLTPVFLLSFDTHRTASISPQVGHFLTQVLTQLCNLFFCYKLELFYYQKFCLNLMQRDKLKKIIIAGIFVVIKREHGKS